ncbi:MAG: heavy metal translocating P-type ATPase [Clostridiaceae bacterium]|nr:heavy metal translocating P-type ATPase [Clostridiaceae bacterium]
MSEHSHDSHSSCGGCCGSCAHDHEEKEENKLSKILLGVSAALVAVGLFLKALPVAATIIGIAAVAFAAYPLVFTVYDDIKERRFTEVELMLISVIAACCIGELRDAALVAILYRVGEMIEDRAVENSRKSIDSVSKIQQDFAHLVLEDGSTQKVHADEVPVGSKITVLPYERFPIDGVVFSGISTADASAITGESKPITLGKGVEVKSGMINGKDSVTVVTTELFGNSTASRIVKMVEDAAERKGNVQKFITRFAKYYTPIVVIIAVLLAVIGSIATKDPASWIKRALIFLVASCPCAIVISIPLGFYTGIGTAAKDGVIVKGSVFIEAFAKAKTFVFDKTGTLTTGSFEVSKVTPMSKFSEDQILTLAAAAEHFSSHPIAKSIVEAAPPIDEKYLSDFREVAGGGTSVVFDGKKILCGGRRLLETEGIETPDYTDGDVCVVLDGRLIGTITLRSALRKGVADMVEKLRDQGVEHIIMLTGDNETASDEVADAVNLDEYYCNLLPEEKLSHLEQIKNEYGKVVYVGDGINDAPVLASADAGVAMGLGTQAASEAADVILTNDRLDKLAPAHRLFKRTVNIVSFNLIFAITIKMIVLILGAAGFAQVWLAVFADVGVCIICILISALIGKAKNSFFDTIHLR